MTNRTLLDEGNAYRFRLFCKERNLTAKEVARITGLSDSAIFAYFRGSRTPNRFTKKLISERLGCDANEIFRD